MWTAYQPPSPDKRESFRITVDGHDFRVSASPDQPGVYNFDWLTGPQPYGFTSARSDRTPMTTPEIGEQIRNFLAQINPVTGYIED